jgi:hypothetical protein
VAPANLTFSLAQGASGNQSFTLGNSGAVGSTLHFTIDTAPTTCASPGPVVWLARSPGSGSIAQGAPATTITATADTGVLAAGSYSAFVCVHSDDPAHALIAVPVSLAVADVIFFDGFESTP